MSETLGRITLFVNDKRGRLGAPDLNGKLTTEKGEFIIDLWKETANTQAGYVYKGSLKKPYKKES